MSGCSGNGIGTDPMGESTTVGRLGVKQEVSVHTLSQPAITAQALKAMPIGPKMAQVINTNPTMHRRRVRPIIAPLSRTREITFIDGVGLPQTFTI